MASEEKHLYRDGAEPRERRKFEAEYGKEHGDYVYDATVGKVRREREAERGTHSHAEAHADPWHHMGPCDESCRAGRVEHAHRERRAPNGTFASGTRR
jgi:hypothetical protein